MNFQFSIFNFQFLVIFLLIFCLLLPGLVFSQTPVEPPKTLEQAEEITKEALGVVEKELPGILEQMWREEVMPIWKSMWQRFKNVWEAHIWQRIETLWQKVQTLLGKEIEKRKPLIEEEFEKEKEELKKELPEVGQSLWERFKELIR